MYCTSIFTGMTHIALSKTTGSEAERKQVEKKKRLISLKYILQTSETLANLVCPQVLQRLFFFFFLNILTEQRDCYLIQEQPTLEIISVGSATQATSNLKRSFSIVLIIFS